MMACSVIIEVLMNTKTTLKKLIFLSLIIPLLLGNGFSVNAVDEAQKLNAHCTFTINGSTAPVGLSDDAMLTAVVITKGQSVKVDCETEISYLYVWFDRPPGLYTVTSGTTSQSAGFFGFLHELIVLDKPSKSVTLNLNPGKIASIFAYSSGTLPKDVQVWKTPANDADLMVLSGHGDDEALYFGPAIVQSVAAGKIVQVAYLTNHWADRRRPHETLDSLWMLGVTNYPIFGLWPDRQSPTLEHGYTIFPKDEVTAYEVGLIRRFKPEVILSHDFKGEYGHGAHMVLSDVLKTAIQLSGDYAAYPQSSVVYGTFTPLKVYIHLYEENPIVLDVYTKIASFDDRSPLQVARDAYALHVSQHIWPLQVIDYTFGDVRKFGLYYTSVGTDTGKDLFEHVPPKKEIKPRPQDDIPVKPGDPSSSSLWSTIKVGLSLGIGFSAIVLMLILVITRNGRLSKR